MAECPHALNGQFPELVILVFSTRSTEVPEHGFFHIPGEPALARIPGIDRMPLFTIVHLDFPGCFCAGRGDKGFCDRSIVGIQRPGKNEP